MSAKATNQSAVRSPSEAAQHADFSEIRYAQVWEDADVLLEALDIQPGDTILSIASAGDNALAMLARTPERVIAVDLNPAELHCLELRVAAYSVLSHPELLLLIGSPAPDGAAAGRRRELYRRCRTRLTQEAREFWDAHQGELAQGIGGAGKFERYFKLFRKRIMPLVHSRAHVEALLRGGTEQQCEDFYNRTWDTWRWRSLFKLFFSRFVMGRLGRDPSFFRYVEGSVAERILTRTRHALTALSPAENPYLQWILKGYHTTALPFALREENFDPIRRNLHRLEWRLQSIEDFLASETATRLDGCNLSDIFEYMSEENTAALLAKIASRCNPGARLVYWNMLAPRSRPASLAGRLCPLDDLARRLHQRDKAFFYSRLVVEEVIA
jgi:S-adenosylmethionine-diacylglycerol 3-amino-3-carboxypropyl transferase